MKAAKLNRDAAELFVEEFQVFVEKEGVHNQVFNCNETGLFRKNIPKRTYIKSEEKFCLCINPCKKGLLSCCVKTQVEPQNKISAILPQNIQEFLREKTSLKERLVCPEVNPKA